MKQVLIQMTPSGKSALQSQMGELKKMQYIADGWYLPLQSTTR